MEIRCEQCGKLLAVSEGKTFVDGMIEIKCPKCKWVNVIRGDVKSSQLSFHYHT